MVSLLAEKTIEIARSYLNVREVGGANRGPDVERFLATVHVPPGNSWCAAYVTTCIYEATAVVGGPPQFKGSAGALHLLDVNPNLRLTTPEEPCVFVLDHGQGKGHTGYLVELLPDGHFRSVEGNTGPGQAVPAKDRNGDGVYERTDRKVSDCFGFLRIA